MNKMGMKLLFACCLAIVFLFFVTLLSPFTFVITQTGIFPSTSLQAWVTVHTIITVLLFVIAGYIALWGYEKIYYSS